MVLSDSDVVLWAQCASKALDTPKAQFFVPQSVTGYAVALANILSNGYNKMCQKKLMENQLCYVLFVNDGEPTYSRGKWGMAGEHWVSTQSQIRQVNMLHFHSLHLSALSASPQNDYIIIHDETII